MPPPSQPLGAIRPHRWAVTPNYTRGRRARKVRTPQMFGKLFLREIFWLQNQLGRGFPLIGPRSSEMTQGGVPAPRSCNDRRGVRAARMKAALAQIDRLGTSPLRAWAGPGLGIGTEESGLRATRPPRGPQQAVRERTRHCSREARGRFPRS